jgi:hypothetical protein
MNQDLKKVIFSEGLKMGITLTEYLLTTIEL